MPERLVAVDRGGEPVRMVGMVDETATHGERSLANVVGAPGDRSISQLDGGMNRPFVNGSEAASPVPVVLV